MRPPLLSRATCCWCHQPLKRQAPDQPWMCWTPACWAQITKWSMAAAPRDARGRIKTAPNGDTMVKEWLFVPTPRQVDFMDCGKKYRMFGGAAGPGKSHAGRWWLYRLCLEIPGFEALILRETLAEIRRTHLRRMIKEAPRLGLKGPTLTPPFELRFPNGSLIELGGMDDAQAVERYLSAEYDAIVPDEAVKYDPEPLLELSTRARTTKDEVKAKLGDAVFAPVTNPGGPSHQMLTDLFITHEPDYEELPGLKGKYNPDKWAAIPATLEDNPYLDPSYEDSLAVLNQTRYRQLRYGDWFAVGGQFFPHFSARTHTRVVKPNPHVDWVEALDWGYASWGAFAVFMHVGDNHWHCQKGIKFKGLEPPDVARLILDTRKHLGYTPRYGVADPSIDGETRGESILETFQRHGVVWQKAINRRSARSTDSGPVKEMGWPRLGSWFREDPATGVPWLTFDPHEAAYFVRSIAALMPDKNNPEDVDTKLDDHAGDCTRYFVMSRPQPGDPARDVRQKEPPPPNSWGWWRKVHARQTERQGAIA